VFHGRLKDMLKVGGENVAAIEVESFVARHPAVLCVEVVGAPDPRLDEVPVAFVEVRPGHAVTEAELIEFCQGKIARYKVPRAVRFVEPGTWPMSATKINKRALRARLAEQPLAQPEPAR
jgi:acyl-CoA synthetase (AMP-forming)/AMP-acid ligase II